MAGSRDYNVFQALYMSFYSKELYQDVVKNWKGACLLYLLMVVALIWVPKAISLQLTTNQVMSYVDKPDVLTKLPAFTINDGAVSVQGDNPYFFPSEKMPMAVIDTTGSYASLEGHPTTSLLLTKDRFFYRDKQQVKDYSVGKIDYFELNQGVARAWIDILESYVGLVAYPAGVVWTYFQRVLYTLLYSLLLWLFASTRKLPISYGAAFRLAVVARTPILIVTTILGLLPISIPMLSLATIIGTVFLLRFALYSAIVELRAKPPAVPA